MNNLCFKTNCRNKNIKKYDIYYLIKKGDHRFMDKEIKLKEVKIYIDAETKQKLQTMAKAKNVSLKTFIKDTLVQVCDISFLNEELRNLKTESSDIIDKIKKIR